jgi:hypothetical protein
MIYATCPICPKVIRARHNVELAFRYHLREAHNTISQEEREDAIKKVMAQELIKKCRKHKHKRRKSLIPKGLPLGLRTLHENKSYPFTVSMIDKCEKAHRGNNGNTWNGCEKCKYKSECSSLFDKRVNRQKGEGTWELDNLPSARRGENPTVKVIVPQGNLAEVLEAVENQLSEKGE